MVFKCFSYRASNLLIHSADINKDLGGQLAGSMGVRFDGGAIRAKTRKPKMKVETNAKVSLSPGTGHWVGLQILGFQHWNQVGNEVQEGEFTAAMKQGLRPRVECLP